MIEFGGRWRVTDGKGMLVRLIELGHVSCDGIEFAEVLLQLYGGPLKVVMLDCTMWVFSSGTIGE